MAVVGTAEVLIRAVDTGFEAELKSKVGAAVDKTAAATKGVGVGVDGKALEKDLAAAETQYKGFFGRISGLFSAKPASIPIALDGEKAEKAAAGIVTQLRQVTGAVGGLPGAEKVETITAGLLRMEAAGKTSALALAGLGPVILAVAGAAIALKGISDFVTLGNEVRRVQLTLGGSAEEASKVIAVSKVLGVNVETVSTAMFRFSNNLDTNADKLKAYGVVAIQNERGQRDTYASLLQLADAYKATGDAGERTRILQLAFGRGGKDLAVILAGGSEALKQFAEDAQKAGVVLDDKQVEQARTFSIQLRQLEESAKGVSVVIGAELVPTVNLLANGLRVLTEGRLAGAAKAELDGLKTAADSMFPILSILELLPGAHKAAGAAAAAQAASEKTLGDEMATAAENAKSLALATLPDAITAIDKAHAAAAALAADPNANVEAAQRSLEDAQQKVIDLTDQAKAAKVAYAEKVTSANRAVIDSERSLAETIRSADQRIGDDEKSLAKAQLDAVQSVADAKAAAAKADLDAHATLRHAERALSDERARQNAGGNQALLRQLQNAGSINSATAAVDKARADAAATAAKGAESVTKAQTDGLTKVQAAQQSLDRDRADSARQIEAAERSVADAKTAQNKVALEAVEVAKKAALAERDIVRAVEAVGTAQKAVADAAKKDAEAAVAVEKAVIDALVNEQVARDAAVGIIDDETRKLEIRKQIIADTLKGLDPASPQGQFVLGLGLIISGLAHDFGDAAAKAVTLTSELAGLNGQLDGLTGDANANGPGGGRGAALNQATGRIAELKRLLGLAAGGPAMAGESYWVGESGPERLDMFRNGGGFVTPLSGNAPRTPTPVGSDGASHGPLIGQLVVQGATVAASYATGVEVARAVRAREYARSGR